MRVHLGFPFWLRPFVANGVAGITLGERIYLHPSVAGMPREWIGSILLHESVHVMQYRRHGLVGFLARYLLEYLRNRARGMSAERAYREISFEREACATELAARRGTPDA
jgi:hypothetical protein